MSEQKIAMLSEDDIAAALALAKEGFLQPFDGICQLRLDPSNEVSLLIDCPFNDEEQFELFRQQAKAPGAPGLPDWIRSAPSFEGFKEDCRQLQYLASWLSGKKLTAAFLKHYQQERLRLETEAKESETPGVSN